MELIKAFQINGHIIKVTLERFKRNTKCATIFSQILVNNDFNLSDIHHGYIKSTFDGNPRLKSPKSIKAELESVYHSLRSYIETNWSSFILPGQTKTVTANLSRSSFVIKDQSIVTHERLGNISNLRSIESELCLSWNVHDVYNTGDIELTLIRHPKNHQLQYFAKDQDLYDLEKLKSLKTDNLAFFFMNEYKRLIGKDIQGSPKAMSGLFAS